MITLDDTIDRFPSWPLRCKGPYRFIDVRCRQAAEMMDDDPGRVLILDTETTGLDRYKDSIIQLSMMNGYGKTIHNSYYNAWTDSWPEAEAVNGISPDDVKDFQQIEYSAPTISRIIRGFDLVVGYNIRFDLGFLYNAGVLLPKELMICDVMQDFARVYGCWDPYFAGWRWQRLTKAADYYGIPTEGAHDAMHDVIMTWQVMRRIAREPDHRYDRKTPRF